MVKLIAVTGLLGDFFRVTPPMGGLFPSLERAHAWANYYGNERLSPKHVKIVPYNAR